MVSGIWSSDNAWWYNSYNQSYPWINVNYWATFAYARSQRVARLSNVWYMGLGDVLQIDPLKNGVKAHNMMVSYRSASTPYMTYHSSNRYRRSLNMVLADWGNSYYYAGRT